MRNRYFSRKSFVELKSFTVTVFLGVLIISFPASRSWGFSEDICQEFRGDSVVNTNEFNCYDLTDEDPSAGDVATGMATYLRATMTDDFHARSSLHFDVVYLLSRLAGMNYSDAMKTASYSEATDVGIFTPYDYKGFPMNEFTTDNIYGVNRMDTATSGFWLHYVPWLKPAGSDITQADFTYDKTMANGSPFDDVEAPLRQIRDWAFGERNGFGEFGLADEEGNLYQENDSVTLFLSAPILGPVIETGVITLVPQVIKMDDPEYAEKNSGRLKALGIYLHAMIDRLSHHFCTDEAYIEQDNPEYQQYNYSLVYPVACGQAIHAALHYKETGHPPTPQRTKTAVQYTYWELQSWIEKTKYEKEQDVSVKDEDALFERIFDALGEEEAAARIKKLCEISGSFGIKWHDGKTCKKGGK